MNTNYYSKALIAVVAALLLTSMPLVAADKAGEVKVIKVSGQIAQIDVAHGKLQLESDSSRDSKDPIKYKINPNDTRVVDPLDKKFFKLEDLRVGQHVTIEFNYIQGELGMEPIAQKIIASPLPASTTTRTTTSTTVTQ